MAKIDLEAGSRHACHSRFSVCMPWGHGTSPGLICLTSPFFCRVVVLVLPLATAAVAVAAGAAGAAAFREGARRRDRQRDAEWALLSNIGAIAGARRHDNGDGFPGVRNASGIGEGDGGPSATAVDDLKGEEVLEGIRLLISVRSHAGTKQRHKSKNEMNYCADQ